MLRIFGVIVEFRIRCFIKFDHEVVEELLFLHNIIVDYIQIGARIFPDCSFEFCKNAFSVIDDGEMLPPLLTKLNKRPGQRRNELFVEKEDIILRVMANQRLFGVNQHLDHPCEASLFIKCRRQTHLLLFV